MYSARVIEARESALSDAGFLASLPGGKLHRYPHETAWGMRDQLAQMVDAKGRPTREFTGEERAFTINERLLCKIDFHYWAERYAQVTKETSDLSPLFPLWASQRLFLDRVADIEEERWQAGHPDGILLNVGKARQLGLSTLTEVILAHRVTTQGSIRGVVAGDVKEQSQYLFGMFERVLQHLPWWLTVGTAAHQTGEYWEADTGASLRTAWGKSARGGLQDRGSTKGNIGRGKTFALAHISELSTWERPEQLEDGLMPGVPRTARTFVVFESTAKGRYDWWHTHWDRAARHVGRFTNIFIPWYTERTKYWLPPPDGWEPSSTTKQHAVEVEESSPRFLRGVTIRLSREQLYWYESTRMAFDDEHQGAEFAADGRRLPTFYEEFPANDREMFQSAGVSIFGSKVLERIALQAKKPVSIFVVEPRSDIAQLKEWERQDAARQQAEALAKARPVGL